VAAVVDWELCTLGTPLADSHADGLLAERGEQQLRLENPPTSPPAFRPRGAAARYAERSGSDSPSSATTWHSGYWKLAIILEGVYSAISAAGYGEVDEGGPRLQSAGRAAGRRGERAERT